MYTGEKQAKNERFGSNSIEKWIKLGSGIKKIYNSLIQEKQKGSSEAVNLLEYYQRLRPNIEAGSRYEGDWMFSSFPDERDNIKCMYQTRGEMCATLTL